MRIILDTNIYIAAALHDGFSAEVIEALSENPVFTIVISEEILEELREKLLSKFEFSEIATDIFVERIRKIAETVGVRKKVYIVKRDAEDNKILECALAGEGDLIVTLDQDLIKLKSFKGIGIIHPKTFSWTFPEYFKKIKEN